MRTICTSLMNMTLCSQSGPQFISARAGSTWPRFAIFKPVFVWFCSKIQLKACGVGELRLKLETVLSRGHISCLLFHKETLCPLPLLLSSSFARRQNPFKTQWLIIYPGNEMPKPGETHHQERKGHSSPAHRYTLFNARSLTHTHNSDGWQ